MGVIVYPYHNLTESISANMGIFYMRVSDKESNVFVFLCEGFNHPHPDINGGWAKDPLKWVHGW